MPPMGNETRRHRGQYGAIGAKDALKALGALVLAALHRPYLALKFPAHFDLRLDQVLKLALIAQSGDLDLEFIGSPCFGSPASNPVPNPE
jgi:hypothetical protein